MMRRFSWLSILTGLTDYSVGHQFLAGMITPGRFVCGNPPVSNSTCASYGGPGAPGLPWDVGGPSADQFAVKYLGQTDIPSLVLASTRPGNGQDNYQTYLSWKDNYTPALPR